ncbi:MAG: hypothetical protein IH599_05120 [Bacteroidales bacterium]|nr:hypothetical protein [Bacteroidales bacterium]
MDRPLKYKGGIQTIFQRAESSTFFGREIGLMYVHEHLRYAESQAVTGRADSFVRALRQANPVAYREIVKQGDLRQSNCYYSSSDVVFSSRYEADARYAEVISGRILLKGGWRVYSSGPAIFISLIMKRLLGLRHEHDRIIIDPVLPFAWDGFKASLRFLGFHTIFSFSVKQDNHSPKAIRVNQTLLDFTYEANEYRQGGAIIPTSQYISLLDQKENTVEILI